MTITAEGGGYLRTSLAVISGHDVINPESRALHSVESTGLHIAVRRNTIYCGIIVMGGAYTVTLDMCGKGGEMVGRLDLGMESIVYRGLEGALVLWMIIYVSFTMTILFSSVWSVYP